MSWRQYTFLLVLLWSLPQMSWALNRTTAPTTSTTTNSVGTSFWFTRLDHTLTNLCQGTFAIILINPNDRKTADVTLQHPHSGDSQLLRIRPGTQHIQDLECFEQTREVDDTTGSPPTEEAPTEEGNTERRTRLSSIPVYSIQSSVPIQVYATDQGTHPHDISMLLPATQLGTTYRLIDNVYTTPATIPTITDASLDTTDTPHDLNSAAPATAPATSTTNTTVITNSFGIVAFHDDTQVYVRNDAKQESTATYQLRQGQAFLYHPPGSPKVPSDHSDRHRNDKNSITGWHVVSNRPVAVFVGMNDDDSGRKFQKMLSYEQLMPESVVGTTYLLCPPQAPRDNECNDSANRFDATNCQAPQTTYRYVATQDDTTLTIRSGTNVVEPVDDDIFSGSFSGSSSSTTTGLHEAVHLGVAGNFYQLQTTEPHQVMASKPIYVYQTLPGQSSASLLSIPSVDQMLNPDDFSKSLKYRVAVQGDNSTMMFLHPSQSTVSLSDTPVSISDASEPNAAKSSCQSAGQWQGVEYCCTQMTSVARGMYTLSSDHPVSVTIVGTSGGRTKSKTKRATVSHTSTKSQSVTYYGYNGGMRLQSANAFCSAGGPYARKLFRLPGNYLLRGNATCDDGSAPTAVEWRSSEPGIEFADSGRAATRVNVNRFGIFTLCLDVTCGDEGPASSPATCCTTLELTEEECSAGGPYKLQTADLPAQLELNGDAASCPDDSNPVIEWSSHDDHLLFVRGKETQGLVNVTKYGMYDICMTAKCGQSELLSSQCCARIQVKEDESSSKADGPPTDAPTASLEPSPQLVPSRSPIAEVIQESPTSYATKRTRVAELPTKSPYRESGDKESRDGNRNRDANPPTKFSSQKIDDKESRYGNAQDRKDDRKNDPKDGGFLPARPRNIFFRGLDA